LRILVPENKNDIAAAPPGAAIGPWQPGLTSIHIQGTHHMRPFLIFALSAVIVLGCLQALSAQDLAPRAYVITPTHSNAITLTWSFFDGSIATNGAGPISGATGRYSVPIFNYYHSFGLFGRSANFLASLPYAVGNFKGTVMGAERQIYRSGLTDSVYRFSVNLRGGPAMPMGKFVKWKQKALLGASLRVVAPTGQYDPAKLINWGANRWAFKPEIGYSQRRGHWLLDGYAGVWFFTRNRAFFPGTNSQSQSPIGALEGHLSYDFKPFLWASLDGNFWLGGKTSINGVQNPLTEQRNSRIGGTVAFPIAKHQSLKISYSRGTIVRFGGDYQNLSIGWQYSWLGRPK
jgi:hypothetical protein